MTVWAVVPVKPFVRAKSRLAKVLSPDQREALARHMFRHTVEVLTSVQAIVGVTVMSRSTQAVALAREYQIQTIQESGKPNLNEALLRASEVLRLQGLSCMLVVPADLPLIDQGDIEQLIYLGRYPGTVVLAPDRHEDGTNAVLARPPGIIPFTFGPRSFRRHIALAEKTGATVQIYRSEQLGLDIDTPADLELYHRLNSKNIDGGLSGGLDGLSLSSGELSVAGNLEVAREGAIYESVA